jgi:PadR family transcriptional regulator PadR
MKFSSELLKGSTKNLILATLSKHEMYGYEIIKEIRQNSDDLISLGEGSIYPALHELEKNDFLTSRWAKQENDAPDRKYYHLTKKGKKALGTAKKEWALFSGAVNAIYQGV